MEEEIIYFYNVKDGKYYQSRYTHRWLNNLQNQVKKQEEVIDKVKEYIWRTEINSIGTPLAYVTIGKELLDILKEVE